MKKRFFTLIPMFLSIGCQKNARVETVVWSHGQTQPPALFQSKQFAEADRSLIVLGETVRFSEQRYGPARIDGGALQLVKNKKGELIYGKASLKTSPDEKIPYSLDELNRLSNRRFAFFEDLKAQNTWIQSSSLLAGPDLALVERRGRLRPAYQFDVLDSKSGVVERHWVSPQMVFLKSEIVSADFDASAWVYTVEQALELQEVILKNLKQGTVLQTRTHRVLSQAPEKAVVGNSPLQFPLDDPRFDQVQSFYFVGRALDFFTRELDLGLPISVEIETAMGYPQRTNAAFTYNNQIRLGSGDGETYGPLARDPSIVMHEVGHVVNQMVSHLSTQGEGGSLNEAFADYFAATILDNPKMGTVAYLKGPYKRNLEARVLLSEKTGGLYHDSLIVSGTLWDLRKRFGPMVANQLALKTLVRLGPATSLDEFPSALRLAAAEVLPAGETAVVDEILRGRQWP